MLRDSFASPAMAPALRAFQDYRFTGGDALRDTPVTIAWGRQDATNPLEQAGMLLRLNPRARLEVFDRCRMMPQEEHAERFNTLLRAALR